MQRLLYTGLTSLVLASLLSSCGLLGSNKLSTETCATEQTADGVKSAIFNAASRSRVMAPRMAKPASDRIEGVISNAVASNLDDKLAKVDCTADYTLRLPDDFQSDMNSNARGITRRLNYSVQASADGKSLIYTIEGDAELLNWAGFAAFALFQPKQPDSHSMSDAPSPSSADPGVEQSSEETNPGTVGTRANPVSRRPNRARKSEDASPQASEITSDPHDPTRM